MDTAQPVSYTHLDVYKRQRVRPWVIIKKESDKIQSVEMQFFRNTLNYTLQDRMRNEDIRAELKVKDINEIIAIYIRQWWDRLRRIDFRKRH